MIDRASAQTIVRIAAVLFVVAWLFLEPLQQAVPFWLPFAALLAAEIEFLLRGWRQRVHDVPPPRRRPSVERGLPTEIDADLGWGTLVETDDGLEYRPPPRRPRRRRSRTALSVAVLACAGGLFLVAARVDRGSSWASLPAVTKTTAERLFSSEASRIAGGPVTIRCDDGYAYTGIGSDALGVAFIPSRLALLRPEICRRLVTLALEDDTRERADTAQAILVLAHEAVHLGGERNEGVTECRALQEGVALGERLGLDAESAQRMMSGLYTQILGERSITRLQYALPDGCRDGGALDLRPDDPGFP